MSRIAAPALGLLALASCATAVIFRDPATGRTVNCTSLATGGVPHDPNPARAAAFPSPSPSTGTDVPRPEAISPGFLTYDHERQCAQQLKSAGWTCLSGCR